MEIREDKIDDSVNDSRSKGSINYFSFRDRHQKYLKSKYDKENIIFLDNLIPAFIMFISAFLLFFEVFVNTFFSLVEGKPFSRKICNLFFQWYINFQEIGVGLFGSISNSISEGNKVLLCDKIKEVGCKFNSNYKKFEDFFYTENKDLMESIINDIETETSKSND